MKNDPQPPQLLIPMERVSRFVRQLTHDIRNGLSAIDLEAAFVAELVDDPEASEEVRKLRKLVSNTAKSLRDVSQFFQPVTLHTMPWEATLFIEELRRRITTGFPEEQGWGIEAHFGDECVCIDLEQMMVALVHVMSNAFQFRLPGTAIGLRAFLEGEEVVLELSERKPEPLPSETLDPSRWGYEPLHTTRNGGYGLGLYRARLIFEEHGGKLSGRLEGEQLITRMTLPLCQETMD